MIKESKCCSKVIETECNKPYIMTDKDHEDFKSSIKCWICQKIYEEGEVKVKDHGHVTGIYRGTAHQECNLNLI